MLQMRCVSWNRIDENKRDIILAKGRVYSPFRHTNNDWFVHYTSLLQRIHFFVQVDENLVDVACSWWQVLLPQRTPHKVSTHLETSSCFIHQICSLGPGQRLVDYKSCQTLSIEKVNPNPMYKQCIYMNGCVDVNVNQKTGPLDCSFQRNLSSFDTRLDFVTHLYHIQNNSPN